MLCYSVIRAKTKASGRPRNLENKSPVLDNLKKPKENKGFQRSRGVQSWAGVQIYVLCLAPKTVFVVTRAAGGLVSQRFDERFQAFRGLSKRRSSGVGALDSCVPTDEC